MVHFVWVETMRPQILVMHQLVSALIIIFLFMAFMVMVLDHIIILISVNQFMVVKNCEDGWHHIAYLTDVLKDKVCFSVADIRDDYVNINPINSFIMAKNFWPYIPQDDKIKRIFTNIWE